MVITETKQLKIGILTFHRATNYGAVLQAYALQEYIESLGHSVSVIDYSPHTIGSLFFSLKNISVYKKFKRIVASIIYSPRLLIRLPRRKVFQVFINNKLNLSKRINSLDELSDEYDYYVIGSDQVWNTELTGGYDKIYWGEFSLNSKVRKIAYAVSASENIEQTFMDARCFTALSNFYKIGVREHQLYNIIKGKTDREIVKVQDPTILAGKYFLDSLVSDTSVAPQYLLVYQVDLSANSYIQNMANRIADDLGLQIIEVAASVSITKSIFRRNYLQIASPDQFIRYIANAALVLTTSFHGTALSVIYNKPFYVISINNQVDERSQNLLNDLNIMDRMINPRQEEYSLQGINWSAVNKSLELLQLESREFLEKCFALS